MPTGCRLKPATLCDLIKIPELFFKKLTDMGVKELKPQEYKELTN